MNLAPNGKKSNLTDEQYKLVRTPAFKAWFGDWENNPENASKVVDKNGEPMIVYRGSKVNMNNLSGIWLSNSKEFAENYGKVAPFFVKILTPMPIEIFHKTPMLIPKFKRIISIDNYTKYDGFLGNFLKIVVKTANQIKLADGSNTTFNGNNPDIRYKNGGNINDFKYTIGGL